MKRPLGVIGLVYLVTLAVVFHFYSFSLVVCLCIGSALAALSAVLLRIIKKVKTFHKYAIASSLCVLAAVLSIFLYQNYVVAPIVSSYAGKEITVEGYVCDDLRFNNSYVTYTIQAEKINGEDSNAKITFTTHDFHELYPFDELKVTMTPNESAYTYQYAKRIYLYAYEQDNSDLTVTGEKHTSLRSFMYDVRKQMKGVFESSLDENAAAVCEAVMLGDKLALSADVRRQFTDTGASYLIVVSGMHLAIVTLLLRKILKRAGANEWLAFTLIMVFIFLFMALTGFTPSVTRAGIMMIILYLSKALFRDHDGINSLGIAALALTVFNPYSVGDVGMLLSFAATFGILLWAVPLERFCLKKLHLDRAPTLVQKKSKAFKIKKLLKKILRWYVALFCTSLAATLWVIPLAMVFFGTLSPFTVIISMVAYPLTCVVLLLAMLFILLSAALPFVPFWGKIFAPLLNLFSYLLTQVIEFFSKLPFSNIAADREFYYVWLIVSAVLVAVGYIIHARKTYVFSAVVISVLTLTIGGSLTYLFAEHPAKLVIIRGKNGYTAAVSKENNVSLLSFCGTNSCGEEALSLLREYPRIDYLMMTGGRGQSIGSYASLTEEFEVSELLAYQKSKKSEKQPPEGALLFGSNTTFTLALNSEAKLKVFVSRSRIYQYLYSDEATVLLLPGGAVISDLPEELRKADYAVAEGNIKEAELLQCGELLSVNSNAPAGARQLDVGESYVVKLE